MKHSKFNVRKSTFVGVALATVLLSCSSEHDEVLELTELSDAILEKLSYGCDGYLEEANSDSKLETSASDEYIEYIRERMIAKGGNKSVEVISTDDVYVGVIESNQGCGKYSEVVVNYDCEDSKTANKRGGYTASWEIGKNIKMKFCIVPASILYRNSPSYGVVAFHHSNGWCQLKNGRTDRHHLVASEFRLHMDAEDSSNATKLYVDGQERVRQSGKTVQSGTVIVTERGDLEFTMYAVYGFNDFAFDDFNSFPYLGFEYGVFGSSYEIVGKYVYNDTFGYVTFDDEDSKNANAYYYWGLDSDVNVLSLGKNDALYIKEACENFFSMGKNTTMYLRRVPVEMQSVKPKTIRL